MGLTSVDNTKVGRGVGCGVTTKRNSTMISDSGGYHDALGHLRRDRSSTDPFRGVLLKASDGKCSPRVDLAIRKEDVGWIHEPSTVSLVEGVDVRLRGDSSLWERAQAGLLLVFHAQELRLNASVVVGIGSLIETYPHAYNQTKSQTTR